MPKQFDFVSATDKPALLAFSTPEWLEAARTALNELGYKVHTAATHSDFLIRFSQVHYQVVILEELFAANTSEENLTLHALQHMSMNERRHATIILFGDSFQTFTPMQAFQQSVHAVINSSELFLLNQLIEKAVADNTLFLTSFREAQNRALATAGKEE
jgi:DNA-binding SARP family transcriptional activator